MGRWLFLSAMIAGACVSGGDRAPPSAGVPPPAAGTTALVGAFRGPYTILGVCGNCETQDRFYDEGSRREVNVLLRASVPGHERVQAQTRCRALGRWLDHPGSCGEGQCRSFVVEAVRAP
ncbi:MAG: hypothetical protein DYH12_16030 [Sorangiineae bacterium PRO1]|nr:hypothetical protein [Sorangiineae bacterium PRO1]